MSRDRTRQAANAASKTTRKASSSATAGPRHARVDATPKWGVNRGLMRYVAPVVLTALTVGALVVGLPSRTFFNQRQTSAIAEQKLSELEAANAAAEAQVAALQSDSEIERLAREHYGYAKAGEEVYHVLPSAQDPVRVPEAWPFTGLGARISR